MKAIDVENISPTEFIVMKISVIVAYARKEWQPHHIFILSFWGGVHKADDVKDFRNPLSEILKLRAQLLLNAFYIHILYIQKPVVSIACLEFRKMLMYHLHF